MKLRISLILISSIFIIIGITIKYNYYYNNYKIEKKELNNIYNYIEGNNNDYLFVLEIPKINLKRGIINNSNVDKDIVLIDYQKYLKNDIILASHSGDCNTCYFNKLDLLNINDLIYIYKDNIKYTYKIDNIEEKIKQTFKLEDSSNSITLITCKKNTQDMQIIIKGKIINNQTR